MTAVYAETRHFSYETASAEFEIPERWLRTHIKTLPHRRFGRYVRFSVADLIAISEKFAVENAEVPPPAPARAMPDIRPSSQRRTRNREPGPAPKGRSQDQHTHPEGSTQRKGTDQ